MEFNTFVKCWDRLCTVHNEPINTNRRHAYFIQLGQYSDEDLFAAIEKCLREIKWFPKIPEILERIPVKRLTADDWDGGVKPNEQSVFSNTGKYSTAHLSDDELREKIQAFRRSWPDGIEYTEKQLEFMMKHCRAGSDHFCFAVGIEQNRPQITANKG